MAPTRSDSRPDLADTTAIVTGASDGIGAVAARELARAGARVVLAVRNPAKAAGVSRSWGGEIEIRELDLASLESVRAFAAGWSGPIGLLINNAGVMQADGARTRDGFEPHIGINHLGHFALTGLLLPEIVGRVITVSSDLHKRAKLDLEDLNWERRRFKPFQAYSDSKLANLLFARELQRRLTSAHSPVASLGVHPGISSTNLASDDRGRAAGLVRRLMALVGQDAEGGALPTLYAANEPPPESGYVGPGGLFEIRGAAKPVRGSAASQDSTLARRLWERSAELTGLDALERAA